MKKKIYEAFDEIRNLSESIDNISEDSVYAPINIDMNKIKRGAFEMAGIKNSKKHIGKKWAFTLIAVAAAVAVLGTVGVGAMGAFNEVFGERFAGEKVNGIYAGGNVKIQTNESIKAELLGIAGDRSDVMAAVSIQNADGTPFVNYDDVENTIVTPSLEIYNCLDENGEVYEELPLSTNPYDLDIEAATSQWTMMQARLNPSNDHLAYDPNKNKVSCIDFSDYDMRLTDPSTAKIIYYISREYYSLIGETMSVSQEELYILHKDELLAQNIVDVRDTAIVNGSSNLDDILNQEKEIIAARKKTLKDNQTIIAVSDRDPSQNYNDFTSYHLQHTLYVVTVQKVRIDFEGSWNLNYKSEEKTLATADSLTFDGIEFKVDELKASTFKATITVSTDKDITSYENISGINGWVYQMLNSNVEITMKNGEKVQALWYDSPSGESVDKFNISENGITFSMELRYYQYNDYNNLTVWSNLNPEEIVSVTINGIEILG